VNQQRSTLNKSLHKRKYYVPPKVGYQASTREKGLSQIFSFI